MLGASSTDDLRPGRARPPAGSRPTRTNPHRRGCRTLGRSDGRSLGGSDGRLAGRSTGRSSGSRPIFRLHPIEDANLWKCMNVISGNWGRCPRLLGTHLDGSSFCSPASPRFSCVLLVACTLKFACVSCRPNSEFRRNSNGETQLSWRLAGLWEHRMTTPVHNACVGAGVVPGHGGGARGGRTPPQASPRRPCPELSSSTPLLVRRRPLSAQVRPICGARGTCGLGATALGSHRSCPHGHTARCVATTSSSTAVPY